MGGRQKKRRVLLLLSMVFIFIGTFFYLLPYLFELPSVHDKLETAIARQLKSDFSYREGALTIFPRPCIRIRDAALRSEHRVSATIEAVSVFPDLPSLFLGKLNIDQMTIIRPDCIVEIPESQAPSRLPTDIASLQDWLTVHIKKIVPATRSGFSVDIQHGTLVMARAEKELFTIRQIDGRAQWNPPAMTVNLTGKSGIWNEGKMAFGINTVTQEGKGRLAIKRLTPESITNAVFPKSFPRLDSAVLDTNIYWKTGNFDTWDLSFEVTDPDLTFRKGKKVQIVRGGKAAGKLEVNKNAVHVSVTDLDLATPRMQLDGSFDLETENPHAGWRINARDLDIASTREATLFFAAGLKVARKICDTLLEGDVPQISLGQDARDLDGFRDVSALFIRGRLNRGTVHIPKSDLILTDTVGDVTVSKGILEAYDAKTRLGKSVGSKGRFTLSLGKKKSASFHVETDVHADVAALPPLLAGLVKNRLFSDEMRLITSAKGTAVGKMILDRGTGPVDVTVDVSEFDLSALYERIPFPLSVSGGGFHFENRTVQVRDLQGGIGNSSFADLSGELPCRASPVITISKGRAEADVDELVSWLEAEPAANRIMKRLRAEKGRISFDNVRLEGPAKTPGDWQFQSEGHVIDTFTLLMPLFPNTLIFHQGKFTMTQDRIDFSSDALSLLDAGVHAAGTLYDYQTKNRRLDARIEGELGGGICQWIHRQAPIPEMCMWRAPIVLSPLFLHWREKESLSVSGEATAENGSRISLDISKTPSTLAINNLAIQDGDTRASLTLALDKNLLEIDFSGTLNGSTLSALLFNNDFLTGSIQGNFRARYFFDAPLKSTLTGNLHVAGLDTSAFGPPLQITEAFLTGDITAVDIVDTRFSWAKNDFFTSGRIAQINSGLQLDLDLDSDHLTWSELKASLEGIRTAEHPRPAFLFGNIRATCGNFTLSPLLVFQPLKAEFRLNGDRTDIVVQQADTCGISFPGTITVAPEKILFSFDPHATEQALEPTLSCLQNGNKLMDGLFDLDSKLTFQLNGTSIIESLEGDASLTAKSGRIYRAVTLGKIFSLLNIGDILSGDFPDLEKEGLPYKSSVFNGRFTDGFFELGTGIIDSSGMKIFFEGKEDLINRRHNLTVVVAPLKTVDSLLEKIPLVNSVLNKGAIIYPVRVTGSWDKPDVSLLSPTAVGGEVWGIMVRTLRLPVTLLESIFAGNKGKKKEQSK